MVGLSLQNSFHLLLAGLPLAVSRLFPRIQFNTQYQYCVYKKIRFFKDLGGLIGRLFQNRK